jgi:hypothetical protein
MNANEAEISEPSPRNLKDLFQCALDSLNIIHTSLEYRMTTRKRKDDDFLDCSRPNSIICDMIEDIPGLGHHLDLVIFTSIRHKVVR